MGTSTGGTLSLMLAAQYPEDVSALINMSPNIAINHPLAWIGNNPWGLQISRLVVGGKFYVSPHDSIVSRYWYESFRMEAMTQLQEVLEEKMNKSTFEKVTCPSLTLFYFKNEKEQDPTVKVSAMVEMNHQLGTAGNMKETVAIPNAGAHVIGSSLRSKDFKSVEEACEKFAIEKLALKKISLANR
jgi:pimeloyl-ACP methyl ester carboxylesterase